MFGMKTLDRHAELTRKMAESLDLDIGKSMLDGKLSALEYRGAVVSCTQCSNPDDCETWLEAHGDGAEAPPAYCRNKALLARLSPGPKESEPSAA